MARRLPLGELAPFDASPATGDAGHLGDSNEAHAVADGGNVAAPDCPRRSRRRRRGGRAR